MASRVLLRETPLLVGDLDGRPLVETGEDVAIEFGRGIRELVARRRGGDHDPVEIDEPLASRRLVGGAGPPEHREQHDRDHDPDPDQDQRSAIRDAASSRGGDPRKRRGIESMVHHDRLLASCPSRSDRGVRLRGASPTIRRSIEVAIRLDDLGPASLRPKQMLDDLARPPWPPGACVTNARRRESPRRRPGRLQGSRSVRRSSPGDRRRPWRPAPARAPSSPASRRRRALRLTPQWRRSTPSSARDVGSRARRGR